MIRAAQANAGIVVRAAPVLRLGLEDRARRGRVGLRVRFDRHAHPSPRAARGGSASIRLPKRPPSNILPCRTRAGPRRRCLIRINRSISTACPCSICIRLVCSTPSLPRSMTCTSMPAPKKMPSRSSSMIVMRPKSCASSTTFEARSRRLTLAGKIIFGPRGSQADESVHISSMSTLHLLGDLLGSDAVVFDDRALNKEPFVTDRAGQRARIVTSLDIIEELHAARGLLSAAERRKCRHRLRIAGSCLMPLDAGEIKSAAQRNGQHLSPEFRAIRDSIDLPRMAEIPLFPAEIPWFMTINSAVKTALVEIWNEESDPQKAAAIADAVYSIYPTPEDWVACWKGQPPPEWIMAVNRILRTTLALPFELGGDPQALDHYNEWLERTVLEPMRKTEPESYRAIGRISQKFVLNSRNDEPWRNLNPTWRGFVLCLFLKSCRSGCVRMSSKTARSFLPAALRETPGASYRRYRDYPRRTVCGLPQRARSPNLMPVARPQRRPRRCDNLDQRRWLRHRRDRGQKNSLPMGHASVLGCRRPRWRSWISSYIAIRCQMATPLPYAPWSPAQIFRVTIFWRRPRCLNRRPRPLPSASPIKLRRQRRRKPHRACRRSSRR